MTGGGTIQESGNLTTSNNFVQGVASPSAGSGSGQQSGSTLWSYSGSGAYTDSNATSGISFFVPGSLATGISGGTVSGSAWASGRVRGTIGDNWADTVAATTGAETTAGGGSLSLNSVNSASYSGTGYFLAAGGVTGGGTIQESGNLTTTDAPATNVVIAGAGTLTLTGGSGSGQQSGSTLWSYSGTGTYTDSNATSGISFFVPGSAATGISGGTVSGSAWASGRVTGTIGDSWADTIAAITGAETNAGGGSLGLNSVNDASYAGTGYFTATGAVTGGGMIEESGNLHITGHVATGLVIAGSATLTLSGSSGSGSLSGSTSWSYWGWGAYTDANGTSGVAFFVPGSASPSVSGTVSGSAWASGTVSGIIRGSLSPSTASSATITTTITNEASYSGSGYFTVSGAVTGGGAVQENGNQNLDGGDVTTFAVNLSTGTWVRQNSTGSGSQSGSTSWSYSGSGTYTDASATSGIASTLPAYTSITGSATGVAIASGQVTTSDSGNWTEAQNGSGTWSYPTGAGSTTTIRTNAASYSGSGTFETTGALTGSGTIEESVSYSGVNSYGVDAPTGNWVQQNSTGSGTLSGSTSWSYSGMAHLEFGVASAMSGSASSTFSQPATWVNAPMPPGPRLVGAESNKTTEAFMQACFAAGTPLLTPHGVQPIERFRVGDAILSRPEWDPAGPVDVKIVEEVFVRTAELWNLHVGGRVIQTTAEHPVWVQGRGWLPVRELQLGDVLSSHDGKLVHVDDLLETGERAVVYNLRVSDWHTYFVGAPEWGFSVWVHNGDYAEDNRSWWQIGADFVESRKERFVDGLGQLERGFEALPAASVQKAEEIWENAGNIRHGRFNPNFVRGLKMIVDDPIENIPQTGKIGALNLAAPAMELGRAIGEGDERKIMTAGAHVGMQYMGARTTIQSFGPKIPELAPKSGFFGARGPASLREFDPAASGGPIPATDDKQDQDH